MSLKLEDAKAELIGRAAAIAHERVGGDQASALATFTSWLMICSTVWFVVVGRVPFWSSIMISSS